jgi:hypothetical protein
VTPSNRQIVVNWIMLKVPQYRCAFCGGQTWSVGDVVMPPLASNPAAGHPVVAVQCATCARVDFFDAVSVGLKPPFA